MVKQLKFYINCLTGEIHDDTCDIPKNSARGEYKHIVEAIDIESALHLGKLYRSEAKICTCCN